MGWLDRLMFWRSDDDGLSGDAGDAVAGGVEAMDGYDITGCFTLPDNDGAAHSETVDEACAPEATPDISPIDEAFTPIEEAHTPSSSSEGSGS